jgi:hypothetical protein
LTLVHVLQFFKWEKDTLGPQQTLIGGFQESDGFRWGRPVGAAMGPDGALYVTDDEAGAVYRLEAPAQDPSMAPGMAPGMAPTMAPGAADASATGESSSKVGDGGSPPASSSAQGLLTFAPLMIAAAALVLACW